MGINEQIKKYRKAAGYTQEQIANYLGVSTPAVNKWEKGISFPDITLLPALARLLKIDIDTLLEFQESLTDIEIEAFIRELIIMSQNNLDEAFEMAKQKIKDYPNCDNLLISISNNLMGSLFLRPMEESERQKYEDIIFDWLEIAAKSSDEDIRNNAIATLLGKVMAAKDYDRAESLLSQLPKQQFDKVPYEANILIHQEKYDDAIILLESKLLNSLGSIQTYCLKLLELELQNNQIDRAKQIAKINEEMVNLFGLWKYGAVAPNLQIAIHEKDESNAIAKVKEMLQAANTPWIISDSPLFYKIAHQNVKDVGKSFIPVLISELKTSSDYDLLRNNQEFIDFLKTLDTYES